ncbi:hypothetical protein [Streptomyces sp. NPDC059452]|uniref:hypothetical protein n=1 Tax=Streptomyces sp. NPDC059452 TaxID=3346835 RepID=UPI0036B0692F
MFACLGALTLAAVGFFVYLIHIMSDPISPALVGMRIDGDRITIKAGQCPEERVRRVEVWDSDTERLLWRGDKPVTDEGKRGLLTLWDGEAYGKSSPAAQPSELPNALDVLVESDPYGGPDGLFSLTEVRAADLGPGSYWTRDGVKTAAQLDAVLDCGGGDESPEP